MAEPKKIEITPEELSKSFITYRKDILQMPVLALEEVTKYMQLRKGVRYVEEVGELAGAFEIGPFSYTRIDDEQVKIVGRKLETFLGSGVKEFNPVSVVQSIYGSAAVQGDALKNTPITKLVAMYLFKLLGEAFRKSIFTAKRNDAGKTTAELYNGFKTIADAEVLAGNLATSKGNLFKTTAMTAENAVDVIEEFIDAADEKLRGEKTILFCNKKSKTLYERAYRNTYGHLNYNKEFNKTYIDGDQKCEIVGLSCVPDGFKLITPKNNMLVGIATEGEKCNFEIEKSLRSHFLLDFVATMFFGCQYESISKERMLAGYDVIPTA